MRLCKILFFVSFSFTLFTGSVFAGEVFVSNLKLGSRGEEVLLLQKVLNQDPETVLTQSGPGSVGNETSVFGILTQNAVIRFQEKYKEEILTSQGLVQGTGLVGIKTREVLNRLAGSVSINVVDVGTTEIKVVPIMDTPKYPRITALSTGVIDDPFTTPLVILGENFTQKNEVFVSIDGVEIFDAPSIDGNTISVFLISKLTTLFENAITQAITQSGGTRTRKDMIDELKVRFNSTNRNGVYVPAAVFVRNENGESNKFQIKVNILRD